MLKLLSTPLTLPALTNAAHFHPTASQQHYIVEPLLGLAIGTAAAFSAILVVYASALLIS